MSQYFRQEEDVEDGPEVALDVKVESSFFEDGDDSSQFVGVGD